MTNKKIVEFFKEHKQKMLVFLEKIVLTNSWTYNKPGVDRVVDEIISELSGLNLHFKRYENSDLGDNLTAATVKKDPQKILICGHTDTVFPPDKGFNCFEHKHGAKLINGPGVIDMKGGLVVGIFALKALHHLGVLHDIPITFIFNSDEEIGSPKSKQLIISEARQSSLAFVLECGGLNGEVVTGRKGKLNVRIDVKGKAGHAGFAHTGKKSAILELAHKVIALEQLNDYDLGITVNVGQIEGGIGPNTVPERASAYLDIRFNKKTDKRKIKQDLDAICARSVINGTQTKYKILSSRPPMEQTEQNRLLFSEIQRVAHGMNISIREEFRSGVSDANFIAQAGIPVIDGLGPIGDADHSSDEYMLVDSLVERAILFTSILLHFGLNEDARAKTLSLHEV